MIKQLAINSNTYYGYSLEDAVKGASEAGFMQIEIGAVRDRTLHVSPDMSREQLGEVKALLAAHDMQCVGISAHSNVMTEEGIAYLLASIDLTVEFNCNYIVTATGASHGDTEVISDIAVLSEKLAPVIEKCERLNKVLVIETHGNNFATGAAVKKLTQALNDRVKVNYDTGNVILYGGQLPYEDLESSIDYVKFIHLKDKLGADNEWNFPAIGDGELDFNRIFTILREASFQDPISVEIEFTPAGPSDLEEINDSVKRSYEYLSKLLT